MLLEPSPRCLRALHKSWIRLALLRAYWGVVSSCCLPICCECVVLVLLDIIAESEGDPGCWRGCVVDIKMGVVGWSGWVLHVAVPPANRAATPPRRSQHFYVCCRACGASTGAVGTFITQWYYYTATLEIQSLLHVQLLVILQVTRRSEPTLRHGWCDAV